MFFGNIVNNWEWFWVIDMFCDVGECVDDKFIGMIGVVVDMVNVGIKL